MRTGPKHLNMKVSRAQFENMVQTLGRSYHRSMQGMSCERISEIFKMYVR